jgi:hypothetical protein
MCGPRHYLQQREELTYNDEVGVESPSDDESLRSPLGSPHTPPDSRSSSLVHSKQRGSTGLLHVRPPLPL